MKSKTIFTIGCISFSILLTFSILYYKERTVFADMSFHLFYILKDGTFAIQNNRYGAAITQIFPLISSKFGFSLSTVALNYSIGFALLYLSTFLLLIKGFKNNRMALAYLIVCLVMTTHTFYWIQSELPQGIAFLFVFISLLDNTLMKEKVPGYFFTASSILLFILCFIHPLLLFACLFSFINFYILYPNKKALINYAFFTYLSFYIIKSVFFKTAYDNQAIGRLSNIVNLFPHYLNLSSNKKLLHYFIHDYYFLIVLLVIIGFYYIKNHEYKKLALLFCFFIGYIFIVNISFPDGADQFYLENQYLLLAVFVSLPFAFDFLPNMRSQKYASMLICLIVLSGIIRIYTTHELYTTRLNWNRNLLKSTAELANKKLIFHPNKFPKDTLLLTWSSCYEFWLLSTMEDGKSFSIIEEETPNEFDWAIGKNNSFISKWGVFDYSNLNKRYFKFEDSSYYVKK